MPKRPRKINHPYEDLKGEALDRHMIDKHGWTQQMVAQRGSQTSAGKEFHYTEGMHQTSHTNAHYNIG